MKSRKVILTIEVETDLPTKDLAEIKAILFPGKFGDWALIGQRCISDPKACRGTICQVQANVVKASKE